VCRNEPPVDQLFVAGQGTTDLTRGIINRTNADFFDKSHVPRWHVEIRIKKTDYRDKSH